MIRRAPGRWTTAAFLLLAALALWRRGADTLDAFRPPADLADFCGRDLSQDWLSARAVLRGESAYLPLRTLVEAEGGSAALEAGVSPLPYNAHPPASVLLALPFARFDPAAAWVLWSVLSCAALVLSLALISRRLSGRFVTWTLLPVLVLIATSHPFNETVWHGQLNCFILLALTAAWIGLTTLRDRAAGTLIGLATSIKLFPALLFVPVLLCKRFRAAAAGGVCIAAVLLASLGVLGADDHRRYASEIAPSIQADHGLAWGNQSLPGLWRKLFNPAQSKFIPLYPSRAIELVCTALSGAAVLLLIALAALSGPARQRLPEAYLVAVAGSVLLSPVTWNHYFILLLLPAAWALARLRGRPAQAVVLVVCALLWLPRWTVWKYAAPGRIHDGVFEVVGPLQCAALGVQTYAVAALMGVCAWVSVREVGTDGTAATARAPGVIGVNAGTNAELLGVADAAERLPG